MKMANTFSGTNKYVRRFRRCAAACLLAFCMLLPAGCSRLENTEIVFTTGFKKDQLFKVGRSVCTLPEAMIYVNTYEDQYESVYGVEMWEHDFGGVTLEEYLKDSIVSQLAAIKAMTLLAKEYEVELTDGEKKLAEQAARAYDASLSGEEREWMGVTEEDARTLYEDHLLANRVYEEITKDVNTEVSDDEARVMTVQQIFLSTVHTENGEETPYSEEEKREVYDKACGILEQLREGKEFLTLASIYNQSGQITNSFGRGEMEAGFEEAAFALETDEISDVIETDRGYYILKCTENFDRDATERNKTAMIEKRKDTVFQQAYDELIANTPSEFNTRLWEQVHFADRPPEHTGDSFFAVYEQYIEN